MLVFIGPRLLGEFPYDPGEAGELGWKRDGALFVCPFCGEVWGRIVLVHSTGKLAPFSLERVSCERHPDSWNVPGSMLVGRLEALLPAFPPMAVMREFEVHAKYYLKE